jgi:HPt (histidine-containing phosphotransfer) domain-containing protein
MDLSRLFFSTHSSSPRDEELHGSFEVNPAFDASQVETLKSLPGSDQSSLFEEIGKVFLLDTPGAIDEIKRAAAARDLQALALASHRLKGSCGNFGAFPLHSLAEAVENLAKEGLSPTSSQIVALEAEAKRLLESLSRELDSGIPPRSSHHVKTTPLRS